MVRLWGFRGQLAGNMRVCAGRKARPPRAAAANHDRGSCPSLSLSPRRFSGEAGARSDWLERPRLRNTLAACVHESRQNASCGSLWLATERCIWSSFLLLAAAVDLLSLFFLLFWRAIYSAWRKPFGGGSWLLPTLLLRLAFLRCGLPTYPPLSCPRRSWRMLGWCCLASWARRLPCLGLPSQMTMEEEGNARGQVREGRVFAIPPLGRPACLGHVLMDGRSCWWEGKGRVCFFAHC